MALDAAASAAAISDGSVDAAIFVISPYAPMIRTLLADPDVALMSFDRDQAYVRRHAFISSVLLPRGAIDPAGDLPNRDTTLIAAAANLVVRDDIHSALIPLFIEAARRVHDRGGLVSRPGMFPSLEFAEFPVHPDARRYFANGPSALHRIFPFWLASFIDRSWIMLLPLATLLIPLFKLAPPIYRWRIRVRIYRWYRVVRAIDQHMAGAAKADALREDLDKLRRLEDEVADVWVPLSFMEEFYNLRLHIAFVNRRVERGLSESEGVNGVGSDEVDTAIDAVLPDKS